MFSAMQKFLFTIPTLLFAMQAVRADSPDWENHEVLGVNKELPRATAMPFPDRDGALSSARLESPWCRLLNGDWKFHYTGHPGGRPAGFEDPGFDVSGWAEIPVPSNWQLHGFGRPLATGDQYPFAVDPPRVTGEPPGHYLTFPEESRNPVGSYRREFDVPDDWRGRPVVITFQGVDSAMTVWVNGERVGYSQDSRTPAEFEISGQLREGANVLAVEVFQYSDGSYLENHGGWQLSGIFRDVVLWSPPPLELRDHWVRAGLNDEYTEGTLTFGADLANRGEGPQVATLKFELLGADGSALVTKSHGVRIDGGGSAAVTFEESVVEGVSFWSAETPQLYPYLITLTGESGEVLACYAGRTGFRRNEVRDGRFLHNGKPVLFKGVNRHEHHPRTGHHVTAKDMRDELLQMKRANINAIRCAHHPSDPHFYELTDELGFYVINEANIGSRGMSGQAEGNPLAKDASWGPAHLDRVRNMVERDKNHPSIVMWSMGHGAGDGIHFREASVWIRERDPSRPVHYEAALERGHVGVIAPEFMSVPAVIQFCRREEEKPLAEQRPMILSAYNHAAGNSSGALADYWQAFRSERLLQGGFIQAWKDRSLLHRKHAVDAVADESGNGHATRLTGLLCAAEGLHGGGILVDRTDALDLTGAFTLVAEVRGNFGGRPEPGEREEQDGATNEFLGHPILTKGENAYALRVTADGAGIEFFIRAAGEGNSLTAPLPDAWLSAFHTIAGIYDGKRMLIAIDGVEVASREAEGPLGVNAHDLGVGLNAADPSRRFNGSIRRAAVYGRALAPAETTAADAAGAVLALDPLAAAGQEPKRVFHARGGDFNDRPSDGAMVIDGVMMPTLAPSPQFEEVKKAHQEIHTSLASEDAGGPVVLVVRNERLFRALDDVRGSWRLLRNGVDVGQGELVLPEVAPQSEARIPLSLRYPADEASEFILRVRYDQAEATDWADAGMPIAWDELPLPGAGRSPAVLEPSGVPVSVTEDEERIMVTAGEFAAAIDKSRGLLVSYRRGEAELLRSPLELNFWRAPTTNDKRARLDRNLSVWREAGARATATMVEVTREGPDVVVTADLEVPAGKTTARLVYRFTGSGRIAVTAKLRPRGDLPMIPRIGMICRIPATQQLWTWHGKGPQENHADRNHGAWTTIHSGSVNGLLHRYLDPQEAGHRSEVRWATFANPAGGASLRIDAAGTSLLGIGASPYATEDLEFARHPGGLTLRDFITLHIDHRQMAVGGADAWGQQPPEKHRINPRGVHEWSFLLGIEETSPPPQRNLSLPPGFPAPGAPPTRPVRPVPPEG